MAVTKVKIKGLKSAITLSVTRAESIARESLKDDKLVTRFKRIIIDEIRKNGVLPSGKAIKPVSRKWKQRRNRLAEVNKTSKHYSPGASKLTFTGEWLSSFRGVWNVKFSNNNIQYIIGPNTQYHKVYKSPPSDRPKPLRLRRAKGSRFQTVDTRKREKRVQNTTIGKGHIAQGRDYTKLGDAIKIKLRKAAIGRIRRALKLELAKQGST